MKVLIASQVHSDAIRTLSRRHDVTCAFGPTPAVLRDLVRDHDVLVFRSGVTVDADILEGSGVGLLVRAGSGLDNVDVDWCATHGVELVTIPQPGARAVAELAFAQMLALSRHLLAADRSMREGQWRKHQLEGRLLRGRTLGVLGLGNIGSVVATLGAAWGMRVIGCVERPTERLASLFRAHDIELLPLPDVVARAEVLSVHVPLTDATHHLVDRALLARMRPGALLLNLARGGVVDEAALYDALVAGRLGGAALDVHEREGAGQRSPLADLDTVVLTPHIGAMAVDAQREIGDRIVAAVDAFARQHRGADPSPALAGRGGAA